MTPEQIADIHAACFPARPWTAQEIAELLERSSTRLFHAQGTFLIVQVFMPEAEILSLGTYPELQRMGRARALLIDSLENLTHTGVTDVFLEVGARNLAARALYLSLGFQETGKRPNYYRHDDGSREDAVLMQAALPLGQGG